MVCAHGRYIFAACILIGTAANLEFNKGDLRSLLTLTERLSILGEENANVSFTVTYPNLSVPFGTDQILDLAAPEFGRNFRKRLTANPTILTDDFVLLETSSRGTRPLVLEKEDTDCYFKAKGTALSLCDGIRGILHSDRDHSYLIHPLPVRFRNGSSNPHLLVKMPHGRPTLLGNDSRVRPPLSPSIAGHEKDRVRRKRETFPDGAAAFVETAVFVDKDLFEHMKSNFPVDTERELVRFVLAMINAVQLLYHDSTLGRPVNFVLKRLEILKDEAVGLVRPPDIDRFLSNFCNWQRTKNPAGDMEPLHWDHALILTGLDLYVRGKHGKISTQVVGLAPVAGMCTATSSCTVNEGRHFESVYVVAHEIGHNLGMRHDGPLAENDCDPSSYIMSPTLGSGKITWSSCSKRYLQKFLDTPQSRCLLDHGSSAGQLDHSAEGALPGERFDANQQCMLKYGKGSKHSSQQPLNDVCRDLHCERERYTWTSHPALEGTTCGSNMWCRSGRCVSKGLSTNAAYTSAQQTPARLGQMKGGWSKWKAYGECASGCLFGEEGRLRSGSTGITTSERVCNNPRPQGTGTECEGPSEKYTACTAQQCLNVPRLTIREFADQICGRAKEVDKELTGAGMQKISSDPEEACVVWCHRRNGSTKSRGWTFPDGTACQTRRGHNHHQRPSYCIKGRCEDFVCDPYDEAPFAQSPDLCPVDRRDDNDVVDGWRTTGLRRREGTIRWKSASGCHYNCVSPGSGVRLVTSKKFGKSSIQLCQPDKYGCGRVKTPFQHASTVCSKYKERVRRLSGLGMQISPVVEDPDRPCRIACQDDTISHRFYLVNGEDGWFPFGTDCSRGSTGKKAYCISGKCLEFGSDNTPLSESEFTLPLLSRSRRSLDNQSATKIKAKLDRIELEDIIERLNRTILGDIKSVSMDKNVIDWSNPIHIDMNEERERYPNQYTRRDDYKYVNYT